MNPMILMGLVSMVLFIGMPKLVENSTSFLFPSLLSSFFFFVQLGRNIC
jgi:hypothetical protein